jgi:DNA processing protein
MDLRALACRAFYDKKMNVDAFRSCLARGDVYQVSERIQADLRALDDIGARVTFPGAHDYPIQLVHSEEPPVVLTYIGQPVWLDQPMISVVGSREPDERTITWLDRHLTELIERYSLVTVSGGARGVDQKVHAISLRMERPTVVFLPSGLLKVYPRELREWIDMIVACGGVIVSEFAPNQSMFKSHFHRRNRLIASLAKVLLVAEARASGGSMMTANWALEQNRDVVTPPGHPLDLSFAGNNLLIKDGAAPVLDARDLEAYFKS